MNGNSQMQHQYTGILLDDICNHAQFSHLKPWERDFIETSQVSHFGGKLLSVKELETLEKIRTSAVPQLESQEALLARAHTESEDCRDNEA